MLTLCDEGQEEGRRALDVPGQVPVLPAVQPLPVIAKIGGTEVLDSIDNLEPNAWKDPAVKAAFDAYLRARTKKGYILQGTPGLNHIESQTAWNRGEGRCSSRTAPGWRTSSEADHAEPDFEMAVGRPRPASTSDKMPFGTLWASRR